MENNPLFFLALLAILTLFAGCVSVTSHTISGYVYDCSYPYGVNTGIGGASVRYGNFTTVSGAAGFFNFTILSPPDPELEISAPGFLPYKEKPSRMVNGGFSLVPESVSRGLYLVVWNPEKSNPDNWLRKWEQQTRFVIVRKGASEKQIEDLVAILKTDRYRNLTGGRFSSAAPPRIVDEKPEGSELVGTTVFSFVPGTEPGGIAHPEDRDGVITSAEITYDTIQEMNPTVVWHEIAHTVTAGGHINEWPSVVSEVESDGTIRAPDEKIFNCIYNSPPKRGSSGSIPPPSQLPAGGPVTTNAGFDLIKEGKNQEAFEVFTTLLSSDPENIHAWNGKGNALFNLGKNEEAVAAFDKAIALNASYSHAYIGRGNALSRIGKNDDAMAAFDKAISLDPENIHAWTGKGFVLLNLKKNDEAMKAFNKALAIDPNNSNAYIGKGNALFNTRNFGDAMAAFDKAIVIDPNNSNAWGGKGNVLIGTGKNAEAITMFDRALSLDQNNTWAKSGKSVALSGIGNDLFTDGKNEEAISYFERSIAMDPDNQWAWQGKGLALGRLGRDLEAVDAFSRSLAINEKNPDTWTLKGLSLMQLGRCTEAKKAFEKSLSLDSNHQYAQDGLVKVRNPYYCHSQSGGSTTGNISGTSTAVDKTTTGWIDKNEIWNNEIHITGNIRLGKDVTLTIEPGTIVYIAANSNDQQFGGSADDEYTQKYNDPVRLESWGRDAIIIDGRGGTIRAVGTPDKPITFRPEGQSTSPAQWNGIYIERGTIQYARILYAGQTAVNILGDSAGTVEISHNEVRYFHWAGLDSHKMNVWIHDNVVEGGGHQGIGVRYNTIAENNTVLRASTGIGIEDADNAVIRNNTIIDCPVGIGLRSGMSAEVIGNTIRKINGYPDGWYYQGKLIYPAGSAGWGAIVNSIGGNVKIENNNVSADIF